MTRLTAFSLAAALAVSASALAAPKIVQNDYLIDSVDPGIRLAVRSKMAEGQREFTDDNVVLFVHGATFPSTPDFDLEFKDYSWADYMVNHGYVVYMFDKRNYGGSPRPKAKDEPPATKKPASPRSPRVRAISAVGGPIEKNDKQPKGTRH